MLTIKQMSDGTLLIEFDLRTPADALRTHKEWHVVEIEPLKDGDSRDGVIILEINNII